MVSRVGGQVAEDELREALLSAAPDVDDSLDYEMEDSSYPVAAYPPAAPGVRYRSMSNPAEEALRQRLIEADRKEKRSRAVTEELDWLENNSLFRGARPNLGESYDDYISRIAKKRRIDAEQRKQRVTVLGSEDAKRRRTGRASSEVAQPILQQVQVDLAGGVISEISDSYNDVDEDYGVV